jgi:MATE family multidrug resistance protein
MEPIINPTLKIEVNNRQILSLALPIALAMVVPQINFITNNIFLGMLGERELGNAGITGVYYLVFAVMGNGLNNGIQSLVSRQAGQDNPSGIHPIVGQGALFAVLLATIGITFTWFVAPILLSPFVNKQDFAIEMNFLHIRIVGLLFLYLFQLFNAFLVGTLNAKLLMIGFIVEALSNIFFDYVLIFGHWGFPQLGFNGAAWASVVAEGLGIGTILLVMVFSGLKRRFGIYFNLKIENKQLLEIVNISTPLIFQYVISLSTWLIFFVMIENAYTVREKAISNLMRNVFGLTGVLSWAFASTTNTVVSNLIGQGKIEQVIPAVWRIALMSLGYAAFIGVMLNLFPETFFRLFQTDPAFIAEGIPVLRTVTIGMLTMSLAAVWMNAVVGTGRTKVNLMAEILSIIIYIGYSWFIVNYLKESVSLAWFNELIYWVLIFIICGSYMYSSHWKKNLIPT